MRWGLVGVGSETAIANRRALPALKALEVQGKAQVWAISSRTNYDFACNVRDKESIPQAYRNPEEIFADPDVEAVYIAQVPMAHMILVEQAFRAGKHVFVEKPVVYTQADADLLREWVKTSDRRFAINHTWLGSPLGEQSFQKLLNLRSLGRLHSIQVQLAMWGKWMEQPEMDWHWDRSKGGGAGWDIMSHAVSIAWNMTGVAPTLDWMVTVNQDRNQADHAMRARGRTYAGTRLDLVVEWVPSRAEAGGSILLEGSEGDLLLENILTERWTLSRNGHVQTYDTDRARWWENMFLYFMAPTIGPEKRPVLEPELSILIDEAVSRMYKRAARLSVPV